MDSDSSTKFIGSLTKFLQSLCNGYVEFEDGVELIGHIYLSVDTGKKGKKIDYILNEKVCKSDNSVTFISNSFHALPEKVKPDDGKKSDGKRDDGETSDSESVPKSTNVGTVASRTSQSSRSAPSPNQNRVQTGTKRPGSPLKSPTPPQRRATTPPSQRRTQSSAAKGPSGSPASKTVPSSPSSSSQDNIPSSSPARKSRSEFSQPPSNQSDNTGADNESDSLVPPNLLSINPPPDFASFLGSLTGDNQTSSRDQRSPLPDTKPDTDVTFIKEEFVSEPSSCAQAGSSGQHSGRSGDDHLDNSGLYPVMLHQNTSVFPSTSAGYPPGFSTGASATATSQQPGFPGSSTSQSDIFNPVPGTSQDGTDPSVGKKVQPKRKTRHTLAHTVVKTERQDPSEAGQVDDDDDDDLQVWPASSAIANLSTGCAELTPAGLFSAKRSPVKSQANSGTRDSSAAWQTPTVQIKAEPHSPDQSVVVIGDIGREHVTPLVVNDPISGLMYIDVDLQPSAERLMPASRSGSSSRDGRQASSPSSDKPFRCPKCGMAYAHQGSLARHRHKCEGTLVLSCVFCARTFHRKDKLREHLLSKHNFIDQELGPPGYTLVDSFTPK